MTYDIDLSDLESLMTVKGFEMLKIESRYLVLLGGAGSGKSYSTAQKILFRILTEDDHRFLIARKTARSLKRSVFQLFRDIISQWNLSELFTINLTDYSITCKANHNQIIMSGLDDVEKLKSIQGITSIWAEEATEITQDDFTQLDLRLRGHTKNYKQVILSFNPISSQSWLKKRFFDNVDEDAVIIHSTFLDNNFIDDRYKKLLADLAGQNKNLHDIYAKGIWGSRKGLIYPDYTLIDSMPDDYEFKTFGVDFGYQHAMTMVETRTTEDAIYAKELYYQTQSLTTDLIQYMRQEQGITYESIIYCDSARPDQIVMIQNAGFRRATGARKDVLAGIDFVKSKKLYVTKDSPNMIKELEAYSWALDKNGVPIEKPVKLFDDALDGLRYAVFTGEKIKISLGIAGAKKHNVFSAFDGKIHRTESDSNFRGYE